MGRLAMNRFAAFSVLSLVIAGAFFSACSDDNANPEPGEPEAGTGAKPGTGGKGSGGKSNDDGGTGAKPSTGGKGGTGGSGTGNASGMPEGGPDSGSGGGGSGGAGPGDDSGTGGTGGAGPTCTEDPNTTCIECPKNDKEFLNGCTDSKCTKFTATLEKIGSNGQRPPLP